VARKFYCAVYCAIKVKNHAFNTAVDYNQLLCLCMILRCNVPCKTSKVHGTLAAGINGMRRVTRDRTPRDKRASTRPSRAARWCRHRVNGDHTLVKFDPSQNQNPVTGWYEIVNIWLHPEDMPQIYLCKKSVQRGLLARVVKYNISNFFICQPFLSRKRLQVTPVDRYSRAVAQNMWIY